MALLKRLECLLFANLRLSKFSIMWFYGGSLRLGLQRFVVVDKQLKHDTCHLLWQVKKKASLVRRFVRFVRLVRLVRF